MAAPPVTLPPTLVLAAPAARDLVCAFGIPSKVEEMLTPDIIKEAWLDAQGNLMKQPGEGYVFGYPDMLEALEKSQLKAIMHLSPFQQLVLNALMHEVFPEDIEQLLVVTGMHSMDQIAAHLCPDGTLARDRLADIVDSSILPACVGQFEQAHANRRAGLSIKDFFQKPLRGSRMSSFLTSACSTMVTPMPPSGGSGRSPSFEFGEAQSLLSSFDVIAQSMKDLVKNPELVSVTRSKYDEIMRDYCHTHRGDASFAESCLPTHVLVAKVLKQKNDHHFDAIPLKYCHSLYLGSLRGDPDALYPLRG